MTDNPPDRARLLGSLRSPDGRGTVHVEARLEIAIEKV